MGCNQQVKEDNQLLINKVDSLESILESQAYQSALLEQVGKYLDSIDTHRNWIEINLETGINEVEYVERMKNLNLYVQKAEWMIGELEKTRSAYASQVKRLKTEIQNKDVEIQRLIVIIEDSKQENATLENTLQISENQLIAAKLEIEETTGKLQDALNKNSELNNVLEITKAESLYRQGEMKEELAKQIQLAPKRKRKALEQARDFYEAAAKQGYEPASSKLVQLNQKLIN